MKADFPQRFRKTVYAKELAHLYHGGVYFRHIEKQRYCIRFNYMCQEEKKKKDEVPSLPQTENAEESSSWLKTGEHFNYQDMSFFSRLWGHFKTVSRHKIYVAEGCFKIGLCWQGIVHDLSKYSPVEFGIGIRYFDGHRSPNVVERVNNEGLSTAWLHHKGRNRHHFEYWIDYSIRPGMMVYGNRMPMRYVAEMVCDRRAACLAYNRTNYTSSSPWDHYQKTKHKVIMDHDTRVVLENVLWIMKEEGEDAGFELLKKLLKITKGRDYSAQGLGLKEIECSKIS